MSDETPLDGYRAAGWTSGSQRVSGEDWAAFMGALLGESPDGVWAWPTIHDATWTIPRPHLYTLTVVQGRRRIILKRARFGAPALAYTHRGLTSTAKIIMAPRDIHRRSTTSRAVSRRARKRAGKR